MTTETETNDAPVEDNVTGSLLSGTAAGATEEVATPEGDSVTDVSAGEFDYVPTKFMNEDGTPKWEKMANSYTELEKKIGSKVGVNSVDDYSYDWGDDEDIADDEDYQAVKENMFELGLSQDQFSGVMELIENSSVDLINQLVTTPEQAQATLEEAWGDSYEDNLGKARTAWDAFAGEGMDIDEIGNNPTIIQFLANLGGQMGEDSRPVATNTAASGISQTEIEAIMSEPDYYTNSEKQAKVAAYFQNKNK